MNDRVSLPPVREVCPTTTRRLLAEGALLVDVRERRELEQLAFDIEGVVVMPLSEFEARFGELPRDRQLVLACESGARSQRAAYYLMYNGYSLVANMGGGIGKWMRKGYPVKGQWAQASSAHTGCCGGSSANSQPACCGGDGEHAVGESCCDSGAH